eukprot:jgi/Chlat1/6290/Chrsp44S09054
MRFGLPLIAVLRLAACRGAAVGGVGVGVGVGVTGGLGGGLGSVATYQARVRCSTFVKRFETMAAVAASLVRPVGCEAGPSPRCAGRAKSLVEEPHLLRGNGRLLGAKPCLNMPVRSTLRRRYVAPAAELDSASSNNGPISTASTSSRQDGTRRASSRATAGYEHSDDVLVHRGTQADFSDHSDGQGFNNSYRSGTPQVPHTLYRETPAAEEEDPVTAEAWDLLRKSIMMYAGRPVGTVAAHDPTSDALNYDQVFMRDFVPSALAFLMKGEHKIVRNFLLHTLRLQSWKRRVDFFEPGEGLMPASFKVVFTALEEGTQETLVADFGELAIGRVAPVDSGLWWIILLRAYGIATGDHSLETNPAFQKGIKLILKHSFLMSNLPRANLQICLADGFDMFPTMLTTDGCCMVDRRMGIDGHPLEIQSLFYQALRCAKVLLRPEDGGDEMITRVEKRLAALAFHIREYYWLDHKSLNDIYRFKTEEYSHDAVNKFNVYPDSIPDWLLDWMPDHGGYLIGNVGPARMDFRFFSLGNFMAITSSLASEEQAEGIMDLVETRWSDLVANMPLKICYPALEGTEWKIITGSDPKNTPWSYHNGGSWPVLLWPFTAACVKTGRPELAYRAIQLAERRLQQDGFPEYYDGKKGRLVGKQSRKFQTWTVAGLLVAKLLLEDPRRIDMLCFGEDEDMMRKYESMGPSFYIRAPTPGPTNNYAKSPDADYY